MAPWLFPVLLLGVTFGEARVLQTSSLTFPENVNNAGSRIVSGWQAQPGQFPHQLALRMVNSTGGVYACGGSILTPEWGITAAHCTARHVTIIVRAGAVDLTTPAYIFETTKYYNHPLYNEALANFVQRNDIGLIEFGIVLTFSDLIKPIRLQRSSDRNRNYDGRQLTASGWGSTWTNSPSVETLNWVYLVGTTNEYCLDQLLDSTVITSSTICAKYYNVTSQSTCQGDSGGPLTVIDDDGAISLIGVASFVSGQGCHVGLPAGFVRPGHYHEWFTQVTGVNFDWLYEVPSTSTPKPGGNSPSLYTKTHEVTICLLLLFLFLRNQV